MSSPSPTIITYSMCILVVPNTKNDSKRFLANSLDNSADVFVKFPVELLVAIFGHLSRQDLLNLEAVYPQWKQIIRRNIWPIERKMIFTRENGPGFIKQFIAQRGQFIYEFELDGMAEGQKIEELIPMMLAECGQVQRIGILNMNLEQRNLILTKLKEKFG